MRKVRVYNFFINLCIVLLLVGFGYYYRDDISRFLQIALNRLQPCQRPIQYSIASLDSHFGLTQADALNVIKQAEKIWESPMSKQLFEYSPTGDLKINFVYDYRQKATDALKKIGIVIHDDRSTYDALKNKYDALVVSYNRGKSQLDRLIATYNADKSSYDKDVNYWNSRGGAPQNEYTSLEQRRINLSNQVTIINQTKNSSNGLVDTMNSMATVLNKLIGTLNLQVNKYNTVGASTAKEFREGEYVSDASGAKIDIFQFNDKNQLIRVLAHELGHAIGLEHLNNPKSIMYYLNEDGANGAVTADDLAALKKVCGE